MVMGNTIESIRQLAFCECSNLEDIQFSDNLNLIESEAFEFCTSLTELKLPSSLSKINKQAFLGCKNLETIWVPNSLSYIGNYAFSECPKIKDVYYEAKTPTNNANVNIFNNINYRNATLWVPEEALDLYKRISPWREFYNIQYIVCSSGINDIYFTESDKCDDEIDTEYVQVYSLSGVQVANTLEGLPQGIYIIRQGKTSKKIVVK